MHDIFGQQVASVDQAVTINGVAQRHRTAEDTREGHAGTQHFADKWRTVGRNLGSCQAFGLLMKGG